MPIFHPIKIIFFFFKMGSASVLLTRTVIGKHLFVSITCWVQNLRTPGLEFPLTGNICSSRVSDLIPIIPNIALPAFTGWMQR